MYAFKVPDIGEGVVEAEVLAWRVAEGDVVAADQVLVELLTDKAEIEIPSPRAGRVHRIHFDVGEIAQVGDVLIEIDEASEGASAPSESAAEDRREAGSSSSKPARVAKESPGEEATSSSPDRAEPRRSSESRRKPEPECRSDPSEPARPPEPSGRPESPVAGAPLPLRRAAGPATPPAMPARPRARAAAGATAEVARAVEAVPAVRELARRLGVELERVRGTGPRGRVMRRDVEAFAAGAPDVSAEQVEPVREPAPSTERDPEDWTREPLRGLRRTIAQRMVHARHTAAHFTYVDEVDVTLLHERIQAHPGSSRGRLSPLAFIAQAAVRGLAEFPMLNASIDDARGEIVLKGRVHLGVATAAEQGLLVPVVRDADRLDPVELAESIRRLAEGARTGTLAPTDLRGSTFTITSLGKLGGVISTPILNWPEVAILGVNAIRPLPRVIGDQIVIRRVMNLSISVDHRIADGVLAARYVQAVKEILEGADFQELSPSPHE